MSFINSAIGMFLVIGFYVKILDRQIVLFNIYDLLIHIIGHFVILEPIYYLWHIILHYGYFWNVTPRRKNILHLCGKEGLHRYCQWG